MNKYIFVTGGVCSSLGKGVAAASIGNLLESRGLQIKLIKIDPYINVDAGTMSPYQHGEVYVTDDGAETDLDLGNYARFTSSPLGRENSITTGQVYQEVIKKEREGRYLGRTVQVIPHITDEIKRRIFAVGEIEGTDVTIVEIGGTVGDIESIPFLEAARQFIHDLGRQNVLFIHLTLVPEVVSGELKTKPTQHSVKELREIGIQPDLLLCRTPYPLNEELSRKIALFTNVEDNAVISAYDVKSTIYEIPLIYHDQKLDTIILDKLGIATADANLTEWNNVVNRIKNAKREVRIGIVGKYIHLHDSYKSIHEALQHGGIANDTVVKLVKIDSEQIKGELTDGKKAGNGDANKNNLETHPSVEENEETGSIHEVDGILIPGGFGQRGIEGMVLAAEYARTRGIPCFGICLGLQVMVIEYARNVLHLDEADSSEFAPDVTDHVVSLLEEQVDVKAYGGTMRLGKSTTHVQDGSIINVAYGTDKIEERHRHRYEVSNSYRKSLEDASLIIAGVTPDGSLVESIQWPEHPWGIGVQFHPEFQSTPVAPHPLFASFVRASVNAAT